MHRHARAFALLLFSLLVASLVPLCALAARLDLPVALTGQPVPRAPYYAGDKLVIRLRPAASHALASRRGGPTRAGEILQMGLSSLDAIAASLGGATFESEFVGEAVSTGESVPPAPASARASTGPTVERAWAAVQALD